MSLVDEEHIAYLPEPERVVDVIFGILAKETDRVAYFREELEGRQRDDQVKTVYKSLASIHRMVGDLQKKKTPKREGMSIAHGDDGGTESKPLM